jgi:lysophospholipase L1-like esterase
MSESSANPSADVLGNGLSAETLPYLLRFFHPDKLLSTWPFLKVTEESTASHYGIDVETLARMKASFAENAKMAACELLDEPGFAALVDSLPFAAGSTVIGLGDSMTDDYQSWFEILRYLLSIRKPDGALRLLNYGISADTTTHVVARFLGVVVANPDWIICLIGTNDASRHEPGDTLVSSEETARNIARLQQLGATQTQAQWRWITPPSADEARVKSHWLLSQFQLRFDNADIDAVRESIKTQSDAVISLEDIFAQPPAEYLLLDDGIHPSLIGQKAIARRVVEYLAAENGAE